MINMVGEGRSVRVWLHMIQILLQPNILKIHYSSLEGLVAFLHFLKISQMYETQYLGKAGSMLSHCLRWKSHGKYQLKTVKLVP